MGDVNKKKNYMHHGHQNSLFVVSWERLRDGVETLRDC